METTITWEQYDGAIDTLRDEVLPLTLHDIVTDLEEAMTRYGITEIPARYEAVQAVRKGIRKGGRYFLDFLGGGLTGEIYSNRKEFFVTLVEFLKKED